MKKRSKAVTLTLMAAGAVTLTGCGEDEVPGHVYQTVQQCLEDAVYGEQQCRQAFNDAEAVHAQAAPRFESGADCEAEFGPGNCVTGGYQQGGSSVFVPMMTGYLLGQALSGPNYAAQPLYRRQDERDGGGSSGGSGWSYATARGETVGKTVGATVISRDIATPPRSSTLVKSGGSLSRGGFGSLGGSRSSAS